MTFFLSKFGLNSKVPTVHLLTVHLLTVHLLAALCLMSCGCTLSDNLLKTAIIEPLHYNNYWDEKRQRHHFRKLARQELEAARATARAELDDYKCEPFSIDAERGFEAGFVDFLLYGGTGDMPTLPPRRYWRLNYQNPAGFQAIQDWYQGYQHGAAVAQASGYRDFVTLYTNDALTKDTLPIYPGQFSDLEQIEPAEDVQNEVGENRLDKMPSADKPAEQNGLLPEQISSDFQWSVEPSPKTQPASTSRRRDSSESVTPPIQLEPDPTPVLPSADTGNDSSSSTGRPPVDPVINAAHDVVWPSDLPVNRGKRDQPDRSQTGRPSQNGMSPLPQVVKTLDSPAPAVSTANAPQIKVETEPAALFSEVATDASPRTPIRAGIPVIVGILLLMWAFLARQWRVHFGAGRKNEHARVRPRSLISTILELKSTVLTNRTGQRSGPPGRPSPNRLSTQIQLALLMCVVTILSNGCSALTNPVLNGVPVRRLPNDWLTSPRREHMQTIPLSLLQQEKPEDYVLAAGDVIGVFIPGVFPLTLADQALPAPPVYFPSQIDPLGAGLPPSLGYPLTIQNNGMVALPLVEPIPVEGLTVEQANERVREVFESKGILQPGRESVLVTLMQPRQIRILVFRQEVGGFAAGGRGDISSNNIKQGTGHIVDLAAYENDVLTALARTGGLPGLDAFDGIFIFRGGQSSKELTAKLESLKPDEDLSLLADFGVPVDYIPTRSAPGEPLPFESDDVLLQEGDVVLLEARSKDFYYTGGLLPVSQQQLPRDYDLDVLEAVAQARGTLINGAFGGNNFTGVLIEQGIGNPNPSALTVIRRTPSGGLIPIRVDLNRALTDPRERIIIQSDDVLILQETAGETFARYLNDIFNFNVTIFQRGSAGGTAAAGN